MHSLQLVIFGTIILLSESRLCYNSSDHEIECEPAEGWCIKYSNDSGVYKGCTDINGLCDKEDVGCYPKSVTGPDRSWCCCDKDLCNSTQIICYFSACITILFALFLS